jgi:DNA-binding ferritin-like protein (Dps family)
VNDSVNIPIKKMLVFTFDMEAGNIEGISVLRSAYKHWYYKEQLYKIDAIQKERHGIGIPVIKLPMGFSAEDKRIANELGRNLRTNERAHVVLPPNWELLFAKLEGNMVDSLKSVEHHNEMIRENVLGSFLSSDVDTKDEDQVMFLKATRFIAEIVSDTVNNYLIPELVGYNFDTEDIPKLRARRIGETVDQRTLSFAIRNLIGANVIKPDQPLEDYVRDEMDLPKADPSTVRETSTPQAPGGNAAPTEAPAGPPRQGPPTAKPTSDNAGTDTSGGQ